MEQQQTTPNTLPSSSSPSSPSAPASSPRNFLDLTQDPSLSDLVSVTAIPSCEYVLKGVQNTLHVLFQVKTTAKKQAIDRPPCDLAIVLDRSGSMEGEKLENSKEAIKQVIQNMHRNDKLHLIVYATRVDVIFEDGDLSNPELLQKHVENIKATDSTNLFDGLQKGAEILKKYKNKGESRVQRIFLFSDGLVNHGVTDPEKIKELVKKLREDSISISSFGIGADFDEELMKSISEHGSGDYFFIENADVIPKFVAKGLRGLLALVGTNAVLKIRGLNGAIVKKIYAHDNIVAGAQLGDLKQNNLRQIVSVVDISPSSGEGNEFLTWSLQYTPDNQTTKTELKSTIYIKYTDDDSLIGTKHPAVEVARTMQEIGDSDLEVLSLLDKGQRQEAIEIKKKDLAKLQALESVDTTGTIKVLREKTEKSLANMQNSESELKEIRKEVHYHGYLQRRNSAYAIFD